MNMTRRLFGKTAALGTLAAPTAFRHISKAAVSPAAAGIPGFAGGLSADANTTAAMPSLMSYDAAHKLAGKIPAIRQAAIEQRIRELQSVDMFHHISNKKSWSPAAKRAFMIQEQLERELYADANPQPDIYSMIQDTIQKLMYG